MSALVAKIVRAARSLQRKRLQEERRNETLIPSTRVNPAPLADGLLERLLAPETELLVTLPFSAISAPAAHFTSASPLGSRNYTLMPPPPPPAAAVSPPETLGPRKIKIKRRKA
jgi:hypothetical protein